MKTVLRVGLLSLICLSLALNHTTSPEISLAMKTEKGIVLITGCSHSKVEEIVRATKQFLGGNIDLVEGGFHLFPYDAAYITSIAKLMKDDLGVRRVAPAHCTGNLRSEEHTSELQSR